RLACSAGDRPAGARVRSPVVWIAGWRETKTLKPIDNVSLGETTSRRAVMKVNANVASKKLAPKAEPTTGGRRQHGEPKSGRRGSFTSAGWKRQHGGKDMPSNWRSPPRPGEKSPEQGRLLLHSGLRSHAELPQDKQVGVPPRDAPQPVHRRAFSTFEPLELPLRPSCECLIEVTEHLNALRAVKPPVVVHPSPHRRIGQASQILQTLVVPGGRHSSLANGLPDRLGGLVADRR